MTMTIMPEGRQKYFNNDGTVLAGGWVYTYAAGTTTPKAAYRDAAGTIPHQNPIPLDAKGEAVIFWSGAYKVDVKTSALLQVTGWPVDNITAPLIPADLSVSTGGGLIGFLYGGVYPVNTVGRWLQDLALGAGAGFVGFLQSGARAVVRAVLDKLRDVKSLFDFMTPAQIADVRGYTYALDVTAAVQAALDYAAPLGIRLRAPAGGYKFLGGLTKPESFECMSIEGDGYQGTVFDFSALPANSSFMTIIGGSGALSGAEISGIQFKGNATSAAAEVQGQGGVIFTRCQFGLNERGLLLHNKTADQFTEFVIADDCDFTALCETPLEYRVTAGNDSFHGSGMRGNCTINGHASGSPTILVGAGALVYNAPLSLQLWPATAQVLIQNNNTAAALKNCNWHGDITLETVGASIVTLADGAAGTRTLFSGSLSTISEHWRMGSLRLCENVSAQSSGAISALLKPYTIIGNGVVTGGALDCLFDLVLNAGVTSGSLAHITLVGANYRYSHLCIVTLANGAGGGNAISILATTIAFNASGWGPSTFTIDGSNQLVITNAGAGFSVAALVAVNPVGYYVQ